MGNNRVLSHCARIGRKSQRACVLTCLKIVFSSDYPNTIEPNWHHEKIRLQQVYCAQGIVTSCFVLKDCKPCNRQLFCLGTNGRKVQIIFRHMIVRCYIWRPMVNLFKNICIYRLG